MANFKLFTLGSMRMVTGTDCVEMFMLVRKKKEYFTDFIAGEAKKHGLKVVVNGSFIDLTYMTASRVLTGSDPIDAADAQAIGHVIQNAKLLTGSSAAGKFYFSQNTCGEDKFSAGSGNPPQSSCSAIGGIAPIIVNGLPYGTQNLFKPGAPEAGNLTGDVKKELLPFLVQKSNAMYSGILRRGQTVGKTALGYSSTKQKLILISQADQATGWDADGVRQRMILEGADNAVFLDCSDSATLYFDGKFIIRPGENKNEFLSVAVGFK